MVNELKKEHIYLHSTFDTKAHFYAAYSKFLKEKGFIKHTDKVKRLFLKREKVHSTALGKGAAAPHIYSDEFSQFLFSLALIREGMEFDSPDKEKTYLIFLIMSDEHQMERHLKTLKHIATLVKDTDFVSQARQVKNEEELLHLYQQYDTKFNLNNSGLNHG